MNVKKKIIIIGIVLLLMFLISLNINFTYANDVDFSWSAIKGLADAFIKNGEEGANYINSGTMANLVNRNRKHINYYRRSYCFGWNFSCWHTIYDGYSRRSSKIKNEVSRTSNSRNCYIRSLGNLEFNINFFIRNTIKIQRRILNGYILYTT